MAVALTFALLVAMTFILVAVATLFALLVAMTMGMTVEAAPEGMEQEEDEQDGGGN